MSESRVGLFANREFAALAGTAFARSQAHSTVLIAIALYADLFQTTGFVEGLFGTAFALVQLLIVLPLGRAIDTGNSKRYLLAGLAINVAVFLAFIFVQSPTQVILVRMAQGVAASLLWVTGLSVVGQLGPDSARGEWFGAYNQVGAVSSFLGDLLGGYLLFAHGFTLTYIVLSLITLLAFLLVLAFLRSNPGGKPPAATTTGSETIRSLLGQPVVRSLVAFRVSFSVGKMAVLVFLPIYARKEFGVSAFAIGGILAGGKLSKALLQGRVGALTDRYANKHHFVTAGALLYAVGTAAIPLAAVASQRFDPLSIAAAHRQLTITPPVLVMFLAFGLLGVADSVRLPASMALFVEAGEGSNAVASSMSVRSLSWKVGQVAGPVAVGLVRDLVSFEATFLVAAGAVLVATTVFVFANPDTAVASEPAGAFEQE